MAAKALTATAIDALKPGQTRREVSDAGQPGLFLVLQPSGSKSWALRYRAAGKPVKLTLGSYPALTLAKARAAAAEALEASKLGTDPSARKKEKEAAAQAEAADDRDLFKIAFAEFVKRHAAKNRSSDEMQAMVRRDVLPKWGERKVKSITRRDAVELLDGVVDSGRPVMANRIRANLNVFFRWCIGRDITDRNPIEGVPKPTPEKHRDRVLNDDEIKLVWHASDDLGPVLGGMVKALLLTGQRRDEVAGMRDAEVTRDLWTIPAERAKNGTRHDVPLSDEVMAVLATVPRIKGAAGYVFSTTGHSHVSGYSKAKERLDKAMAKLANEDLPEGDDPVLIAPWTLHDLRRTVATGLARLGVSSSTTEHVLNHRSGSRIGIASVYQRHDHAAEKRQALETWGHFVLSLTKDVAANAVLLAVRN